MLQTSAQIVSTQSLPPEMGARFHFFGQAGRRSLPPGWLCSSQKRGTSSQILARRHKQHTTVIWMCDLCHKQINKKQTSIRCNHTHNTHWVQQHQAQTTHQPITNKLPPTHKQQSTKGQKHRHTSNQHKQHHKQKK